jgi:hypothetical protein
MIDVPFYQQAESIARQSLRSWRAAQAHSPHVFAAGGFPIRVTTMRELVMMIDTMQENRFGLYMKELGGLNDSEFSALLDALEVFVKFFSTAFGTGKIPIPLSTMIAHLALNRKLMRINPNARILEIGPGCGYLSFFLFGNKSIPTYCQIESTESFYLLQNLINAFLYRERFIDRITDGYGSRNMDGTNLAIGSRPTHEFYFGEKTPSIDFTPSPRCEHFPWWQQNALFSRKFDIITSNANFNEMSSAALESYAAVCGIALEDNGVVFAQCPGGGPLSMELVVRAFESNGFGVVYFSPTLAGQEMAVPNLAMVRNTHPSFRHTKVPLYDYPHSSPGVDWADRMFTPSPEARMRSKEEILQILAERLR